jgi:amino acid permease
VIRAIFLLTGTIIGAGIFALPFALVSSGVLVGTLGLLLLTAVTVALNLLYAQIIVRTPDDRQLAGYAHFWLGKKGKVLAALAILFSSYGALFAYVVLGGQFMALSLGRPPGFLYPLFFYFFGALLVLRGLKSVSFAEKYLTPLLIALAVGIPLFGFGFIRRENLMVEPSNRLEFYGPVLFALAGMGVIPEVEEVLRKKRELLPRAIIIGTILPALVYLIFSLGVVGISGATTTADTLTGLLVWSPTIVRFGAVLGVLTTFTSFISLANVTKEVYYRDLGQPREAALLWSLAPVFLAVWVAPAWFLRIISVTGSLAIGLAGIIICLIAQRAISLAAVKKLLVWLIVAVLLFGMGQEIFR